MPHLPAVLAILAFLPVPQDPAPPEPPAARRPELLQPAPEIGAAAWLDGGAPKADVQVVTSDGAARRSKRARTLAELTDHVVLVHATPLGDAVAAERALGLVRDLVAANQDRRIAAIGFLGGADLESARESARRLGLEHPLALADLADPGVVYADLGAHPAGCVHVVGRGGGVLWHGDPLRETKAFLEAVDRALAAPDVPPLAAPLDARYAKALEEYWDGHLAKAASLAASAAQAALKAEDAVAARDAEVLRQAVGDAQVTWLRALRERAAAKDAAGWLALSRAIEAAFPRSDASKEVDRVAKELKKDGFFEMRLRDAATWLDLCAVRPVLFPERKDAAGDRFADKLASYVRATSNSTDETRTAQALVDRYRVVAR